EAFQLRSQMRRYRLAQHFDIGEDPTYPGNSPAIQPAARAVLEAFVSHFSYQVGVLYVRDRPGSVYVRYEQTNSLGQEFKGRYLESHRLVGLLQESRDYQILRASDIAESGAPTHFGQVLALPLRSADRLLGFCLFGCLASSPEEVTTDFSRCRQALGTLL